MSAGVFAAESGLTIRLAEAGDLDELLRVFAAARDFMRKNGNPNQWGQNRPTPDEVVNSIRGRDCYVVERETEDGRRAVCGTFVVRFGPDPMYAKIEDGGWLSDEPYMTIHALASDGTVRGIFDIARGFAEAHPSRFLAGQLPDGPDGGPAAPDEPVRFLRVDTHRDNLVMQRKFLGSGFTYCGIVHMVIDGTERLAYEKPL